MPFIPLILLHAPLLPAHRTATPALPAGYALRPCQLADIAPLGTLYYHAYDPELACASVEEAIEDIAKSFIGAYGELWREASPVIMHAGQIVAAVQTVRDAPWPDVPPGPFITEVFTDRAHRRHGLARAALTYTLAVLADAGASTVALRVAENNAPARTLYASLGFHPVVETKAGINATL